MSARSFDQAVIALARREGFNCADNAPVYSSLNGGDCGTEFTPESWAEIEIRINDYDVNGKWGWGKTYTDIRALWADLMEDQ